MIEYAQKLVAGYEALRTIGYTEEAEKMIQSAEEMVTEVEEWVKSNYGGVIEAANNAILAASIAGKDDFRVRDAVDKIDQYYANGGLSWDGRTEQ